jgi:hypothetical protein
MKSSEEQLRNRGKCTGSSVEELENLSLEQLYQRLEDSLATTRSAAAILLANRFVEATKKQRQEIVEHILIALTKENSLYTKIELCNLLELGDSNTSKQMIAYLGKIGNNQHKAPPDRVSMKVSYPLPRDIIARSLGRMSICILPTLIESLEYQELLACYEALDAIGFLVFYHRDQVQDRGLEEIINLSMKYPEDNLLAFKTAMCLSAYTSTKSKEMLEFLKQTSKHNTVCLEAERALRLHETTRHCL